VSGNVMPITFVFETVNVFAAQVAPLRI